MKKTLIIILCAVFLLAGCVTTSNLERYNNVYAKWINSNIIGNVARKRPSLKDDFYQAVNWDKMRSAAKAPENEADTDLAMTTLLREQFHAMLEESSNLSYEENLCKIFYRQITDEETRNAAGMKGAAEIVSRFEAISSYDELWATAYSDTLPDCLPFFWRYDNVNVSDVNQYVPSVQMDYVFGTQLKYDAADSEESQTAFQRAKDFYRTMLVKCGWKEDMAVSRIEDAFRFEKMVATWNTDYSDMFAPAVLTAMYPNIPFQDIIQKQGGSYHNVAIICLDTWKNLNDGCTPENLEALKTIVILNFIYQYRQFFDMESQALAFEIRDVFADEPLDQNPPDFVLSALYLMDEPLEQAWYARYVPEETIGEIAELTREIIRRYKNRLVVADWISDYTRERAFEKLDAMTFFIGRATMNDWSAFELYDASVENALLKNAVRIRKQNQAFDIAVASAVRKKDRWSNMSPSTVNAYYSPFNNSINICAGVINAGWYNSDWPYEKKLAAMGSVIGHEITHCFDINGALYDSSGNTFMVWDKDDYQKLVRKTRELATYAITNDAVEARKENNLHYMGEITADEGAMAVLLDIARDQPDFDYDLFFTSFAESNSHLILYSKATADIIISMDTHPMHYFRVNYTLQLFDEFYGTYGIKEGDVMYLPPEKRFKVW